jgi:hypothetical protein
MPPAVRLPPGTAVEIPPDVRDDQLIRPFLNPRQWDYRRDHDPTVASRNLEYRPIMSGS